MSADAELSSLEKMPVPNPVRHRQGNAGGKPPRQGYFAKPDCEIKASVRQDSPPREYTLLRHRVDLNQGRGGATGQPAFPLNKFGTRVMDSILKFEILELLDQHRLMTDQTAGRKQPL
jgi:hypothetical protein